MKDRKISNRNKFYYLLKLYTVCIKNMNTKGIRYLKTYKNIVMGT